MTSSEIKGTSPAQWSQATRSLWKSFENAATEAIAKEAGADRFLLGGEISKIIHQLWDDWTKDYPQLKTYCSAAFDDLYSQLTERFSMPRPVVIAPHKQEQQSWLTEERLKKRYYWPLAKEVMLDQQSSTVVSNIDAQSESVLSHLHDPQDFSCDWQIHGLVIGAIQAGKTANYSALVAKAADAGYKVFIILSGIHNDLRRQTQKRLDEIFTGFDTTAKDPASSDKGSKSNKKSYRVGVALKHSWENARAPQAATDLDEDFQGSSIKFEGQPWLFVIKKESHVLKKVIAWAKHNISDHRKAPMLLIDDEADQASLNTLSLQDSDDEEQAEIVKQANEEATAINKAIRTLITLFPRCAYVGYTASPFANIFADAASHSKGLGPDLFPSDFIEFIPTPKNYFGPNEFFDPEDALDAILYEAYPSSESQKWSKPNSRIKKLPAPAQKCLAEFIVSAAIRAWRALGKGQTPSQDKPVVSSMLVHASQSVAMHTRIAEQFSEHIKEIRATLDYAGGQERADELKPFAKAFSRQLEVTPKVQAARNDVDTVRDWSLPSTFEELLPLVEETIQSLTVQVVNGDPAPDRTALAGPTSASSGRFRPIVWIGGNKLSRGLTIPYLCMSIFVRGAGTADTLLQMGRWFGYRDGYSDLCRICTTPELADKFRSVSLTLDDLSFQVQRMNDQLRSPKDYAVVVQTHPGILVTARNKMKTAKECLTNFAGQPLDERKLSLKPEAVRANYMAAQAFFKELSKDDPVYDSKKRKNEEDRPSWHPSAEKPSGRLWRNVDVSTVLDFFGSYTTPSGTGTDNSLLKRLCEFIERERQNDRLTHWNVWIPEGTLDKSLGFKEPFGRKLVERNSFNVDKGTSTCQLSILQSGGDQFIGVRKKLFEAAQAAAGAEATQREFFAKVRELAEQSDPTDGHPCEGFLRLYALGSKELAKAAHDEIAARGKQMYPLIAYAMWLPGSLLSNGLINATAKAKAD